MAAYNSSNLPQIYEKLPKKVKIFKSLPKWWNFAKFDHIASEIEKRNFVHFKSLFVFANLGIKKG